MQRGLRRSPRKNKGRRNFRGGQWSGRMFAKNLADMLNQWEEAGFTHGNLESGILFDGNKEGFFVVQEPPLHDQPHVPGLDLKTCLRSVHQDLLSAEGQPNERGLVKKALWFTRSLAKHLNREDQRQFVRDVFGDVFRSYTAGQQQSISVTCRGIGDKLVCSKTSFLGPTKNETFANK